MEVKNCQHSCECVKIKQQIKPSNISKCSLNASFADVFTKSGEFEESYLIYDINERIVSINYLY